jgi:hypothetical protein
MDEIQSSKSVNMNDLNGLRRLAEELGAEELAAECKKIASKPQFEKRRDFAALLKAFGEWLEEDPNAGKGNETPVPNDSDRGPIDVETSEELDKIAERDEE